jgi:hypothetical protein
VTDRRNPRPGPPAERAPLAPEERSKMLRAAALRPINVMVLVIGVIAAIATTWWLLPVTLATYASLLFLAARDPVFQRKVLGKEDAPAAPRTAIRSRDDVSPERRARWLPRGETRQKVESALEVYRKVVAAIEDSDDVTRAVLDDAVPRLHAAADRLVDVAEGREKAAEVARELEGAEASAETARRENLRELEERIRVADAEISGTSEELLDLRAKVVKISIDTNNPARANALNASLDGINARLEALSEVMSPKEESP